MDRRANTLNIRVFLRSDVKPGRQERVQSGKACGPDRDRAANGPTVPTAGDKGKALVGILGR
jgi:hypothetical protein